MARDRSTLAFVMDPPQTINPDADTTFALMLEAQERGHEVLYVDPADLGIDHHRVRARVAPIRLRRGDGPCFELGAARHVYLDEEVDLAFQRKDPPVDAEYVVATQILSLCRRTLVLNRPEGILAANEKLYALHFSELMAETLVTRHIPELLEFMEKMGGEMVVKPLDGRGGEGIFHVGAGDRNRNSILEQSTRFGARRVMAQRFLAEVATAGRQAHPPARGRAPRRAAAHPLGARPARQPARRRARRAGEPRARRPAHRRAPGAAAAVRRPLLRRDRRDRGPPHRGQRHEPDRHPGDGPPRRRRLRAPRPRPPRGAAPGSSLTC
jgi:hypothetical protein